jgi:hypothetical protein
LALSIVVTTFDQDPKYALLLIGNLTGERGSIAKEGTFTFQQIVVQSGSRAVLRAVLPKAFDIPAGLIDKSDDRLRTTAEI